MTDRESGQSGQPRKGKQSLPAPRRIGEPPAPGEKPLTTPVPQRDGFLAAGAQPPPAPKPETPRNPKEASNPLSARSGYKAPGVQALPPLAQPAAVPAPIKKPAELANPPDPITEDSVMLPAQILPRDEIKTTTAVAVTPPKAETQAAPARASSAKASPKKKSRKRSRWATLFLAFALISTVLFFGVIIIGAVMYQRIASELPDPAQLEARRSYFSSTKIFDGGNNLIVELTDTHSNTAGRRTYVQLKDMSDWVWKATTATEDPNFFRYSVGFDPVAIVRAIYYVFSERDVVSGGSTITQQVTRNLLLSAQERGQRTATRKVREIVLANELVRSPKYTREKILEIYLNEINYGNLAYGIEAAANTYFGKPAKQLSMPEAAFLAGLPQSPAFWDPVQNEERALKRMRVVLGLMAKAGYIREAEVEPAITEVEKREFKVKPVNVSPIAPHYMNAVAEQLSREYGNRLYSEPGLKVYTALSPTLQVISEQAIKDNLAKLKDRNVTNGAVVVIEPTTGQVLAMAGSADFYSDSIKGQVNVALSYRQPGSSVKPFTYLAALEKGATPATQYWDLSTTFTDKYGQAYTPKNYDDKFHGALSMRESLARSMNIPAVLALDSVGLPAFFDVAQRGGLVFPNNPAYGLAVTLGGAEARLLDLTGAYATLANAGTQLTPTLITRVEDNNGLVLWDATQDRPARKAYTSEHAYLITHMLSDDNARLKTFGPNSVLKTSRPSAVKTGTTNDTRDNLTVGYTPDLVVGVWAGNTDNSPMKNVSGVEGAAPIWRQIIDTATRGTPVKQFTRPAGIIEAEVCIDGGRAPSANCPVDRRMREVFKNDQGPLATNDWMERAARGGDPRLGTPPPPTAVPPPTVPPEPTPLPAPAAQPVPAVGVLNQAPEIAITTPSDGGVMPRGVFAVRGSVNPSGFERYQVEWGAGDAPTEWKWISGPHLSPVMDDQMTQWNTEGLPAGRYTIRVTAFVAGGRMVYGLSHFEVR